VYKLSVCYREAPKDPERFDKHYLDVHVSLCEALPGIVRCEVTKYSATMDGSPVPYYIQTDLVFESQEAAAAAFASDVGKQLAADRVNLQDTPSIGVSGTVLH
jgi:uncharacterized protein (TIGR02118 family)